MQGFTNNFPMPVSRHTETKIEDIKNYTEFDILASIRASWNWNDDK